LKYRPWEGPELDVFARLTPGATRVQAEAELASAGRAVADAYPGGRDGVRPIVLPFTRAHLDVGDPAFVWILRAAQLLVGALAFVVAINLAILLYVRTVTRLGEIAVRTALGASRGRILSQLFIEALALTALGAVAGLACAGVGLRQIEWLARANGGFPFWIHYALSPASVLYGLALAVVAAVIMGVLPGLKATGRRLSVNLQELNGRTATRLGSLWTTLIVAQVAVAAAILPAAAYVSWHIVATELRGPAIPVDRFVVADMYLTDEEIPLDRELVRQRLLALMGKLREEPGVSAVTFSSAVPGFGRDRRIEFQDEARRGDGRTPEVATFNIDVELLETYGARLVAGRDFDARDAAAPTAVIVNRTFATEVLGGPSHAALGTRFRYTTRPEWLEIVGVVDDFPGFPRSAGSPTEPTVYQPAAPGDVHPAVVSLRFAGPIPAGISERVRAIGAMIDPALQLRRIVPLSDFYEELRHAWRMIAWGAAIITITVLLLSATGMHALLSFTIAQRTREIGIRSALGAQPRQLLLGVFGRAMRQLSIGLAVGSVISIAAFSAAGIGLARGAALLVTVAAVITIVATFAALGPARRSLRLPTVDALRVDG
jgi:predicted permease